MKNDIDIAIIDYGLSNLYSVDLACKKAGINSKITSSLEDIEKSKGIILPGVGAFDHAMHNLKEKKLDHAIYNFIETGKPFLGICLGMQLIMEESSEFKTTKGLGLVKGSCLKFDFQKIENFSFPVPNVGWNKINKTSSTWNKTLLSKNEDGDFMYFVHSYYVETEQEVVTTYSNYGKYEYCSSLSYENIHAMQFHPEKSGDKGLKIYSSLSDNLEK